jgi:hypothetical protein
MSYVLVFELILIICDICSFTVFKECCSICNAHNINKVCDICCKVL